MRSFFTATFLGLMACILTGFFGVGYLFAQNPPSISNVRVASSTESSAVITWETSADADSVVNFGKQPHYGIVREPGADKRTHSITLEDLDASTAYHFRVSSTDVSGNQAVSGDFVFITTGYEDIEDIEKVSSTEQKTLVGKASDIISKITDPEALKLVQEEVTEQAQDLLRPPEVIGKPRAIDITADSAKIIWATSRDSNSLVRYASDASWGR
jgi:hypothetical protein